MHAAASALPSQGLSRPKPGSVCVRCGVAGWGGDLSSYPPGAAVSFFWASQKLQAQSWSLSLGRSLGGQLVKSVCEGTRWLVSLVCLLAWPPPSVEKATGVYPAHKPTHSLPYVNLKLVKIGPAGRLRKLSCP